MIRVLGAVRGVLLVVFAVALVAVPEKVMPGSTSEPARSLALVFASRTALLGMAFFVASVRGARQALAWLFIADVGLQVFDTGLSVVMGKGAMAFMPAAIGAIELAAGMSLRRAARTPERA